MISRRASIIKKADARPRVDFAARRSGVEELVRTAGGRTGGAALVNRLIAAFERPNAFRELFEATIGRPGARLEIVGTIERRFALLGDGSVGRAFTFGPYGVEHLPPPVSKRMINVRPADGQSFQFDDPVSVLEYVARPRVYLAALYHPEIFPLPRFSLAVSDLARAARAAGAARVRVRDMQLGPTVDDLAQEIAAEQPDILGISATFGQHDVLERLMDAITSRGWPRTTQLVFGGSLCALNRDVLLSRFPNSVVATGPGENPIADLVGVARGEGILAHVPGIAYCTADGSVVLGKSLSPRETDEMLPELDLLTETLSAKGVVQLESSRGCSYACSFCPRHHKGVWAGDDPQSLCAVVPDISRILAEHPQTSRKVFLVDEEFFGYRPDNEAEARVAAVADVLAAYDLRFETSSRADQVFRRNRDRAWHASRLSIWRHLVEKGLERCLFGIESGVDTILQRFNKKVTAEQNAIAIRMLSLAGVPPRYTYITFDPLMSREELLATYAFQARKNLLLPAAPELSEAEIVDIALAVDAPSPAREGAPLYTAISYMLVSMECLEGAPYTEIVRSRGLLGPFNPNMGRYEAEYADDDIGMFSDCAQRWIDRNFTLDYLFKSIEKYSSRELREAVRAMRGVVKEYAFDLLGLMLSMWNPEWSGLALSTVEAGSAELRSASARFEKACHREKLDVLYATMDRHFERMREAMQASFAAVAGVLPEQESRRIDDELARWAAQKSWSKINELVPN